MSELIHVAAAAIFNESGKLLLALRDETQHQGGLWEFPGGKVEAGEDVYSALARELNEELGIEVDISATTPLIQVPFHYPEKSVLLDVFRVTRFAGKAYGREGQPLKWISLTELPNYQFPAANKPIVDALLLPRIIAISPELPLDEYASFVRNAMAKVEQSDHAMAVMLRVKQLAESDQLTLYSTLTKEFPDLQLIWNGSVESANKAGIQSIHLSSVRLMQLQHRNDFHGDLLGASCHSKKEIRHAEQLGVDYITLSPVQQTLSHPTAEPLGWQRFSELVRDCALPVYALGGVDSVDLERSLCAGGQGVAGIRGFS
ncbi:Nudix family hydrolase [Amphritea japonica]|uniref:8-oxo-dGTP diphosphatase n=1 Tax=Amphritea japonica ATCC BAA-1530 TaxID=1278309 RepID=A0A7R6P1N5_9GAMM|nr:Nudix family hydrolase [Amphritea japonica]BBB25518.1 7,8-dihydro-8-oxoguanine triphosphatase [Amphritea japonica ATCC BAA-1530]